MKAFYGLVLLSLALWMGCSSDQDTPAPEASPPAPPPTTQALVPGINPDLGAPVAAAPQAGAEAAPSAHGHEPAPVAVPAPAGEMVLNPPAQAAPPAANPDMERVKAEKGVGIKGRSLDQYEGLIVTPAKTLFTVRERVVFEIQIPEALKLYKASNGKGPKSHEDFMTQIIEANQIQLPELPPGQRYVYDPEKEELMVERPR
jgi:hypothetical protein